jgi:diguanylate cyclase (GGDEF)-like protein/PAS domain S-box-containing protein
MDPRSFRPADERSALVRYLRQFEEIRGRQSADAALFTSLRLQRADALIHGVFENSFDAIAIFGPEGRIEAANDGLARLFGVTKAYLTGLVLFELFPDGMGGLENGIRSGSGGGGYVETTGRRGDGSAFPVEIALGRITLTEDMRFVAIVRDISDRKLQQEKLRHQALHDALTGLPNRTLFCDRLEHALVQTQRSGKPLALLMIDLDRFKEVNDTLGHQVGDLLLCDVGRRLRETVRKGDSVARLGGDEFAVLLPSVADEANAFHLSSRLAQSLSEPLDCNGIVIEVGASVGIALYPDHAGDKETLLKCADVAMYAAKSQHLGITVYSPANDTNSIRNLTLTGELRRAIEGRQLYLAYQPKLDVRTGRVSRFEGLARWNHHLHGPIHATEFVTHAERTGLIQHLTMLTLDLGLSQIAEWQKITAEVNIALNLSARSLHDNKLPELLSDMLGKWSVEAKCLTLEITESAIMLDPARAMKVAERIAELGVKLSIDDFGTGYSSLAYLSQLPVEELKIDKSFVQQMLNRDRDAAIVHSTIDLAHNLGLKVVAEGVENGDVLARLRELDCDFAQGFFIGMPEPIFDAEPPLPVVGDDDDHGSPATPETDSAGVA